MRFAEGDIFYTASNDKFYPYKLLVRDQAFECFHVLCYEPCDHAPYKEEIEKFRIAIYHAPVNPNVFLNAVFLTHSIIADEELVGYREYLHQTKQLSDQYELANTYYLDGLKLTDENRQIEAIESYSKAINIVPTFFEAIDNRAFCKMDIGHWTDAIEDFKSSLAVQPNTLLAQFSIGECYFKLGDYEKAKQQFEVANTISPNYEGTVKYLRKIDDLL